MVLLSGCDTSVEDPSQKSIMDSNAIQNRTITAGAGFSMFIDNDNTLLAWGENDNSQLGDGTTVGRYRLVQIMDDVFSVSSRGSHTMAIRTDGSLWAWGSNNNGQIGDGTTTDRHSPVRIMDNIMLP